MIERPDYSIAVLINGKDVGITQDYFVSFVLTESINYGMYFAELTLKKNILWDLFITTREEIDVSLSYNQTTSDGTNEQKDFLYKFTIFDYQLLTDTSIITLVPVFFPKIYTKKYTTAYEDTVDNVVTQVCGLSGIKEVDTEPTSAKARLLMQVNQTNLNFLKYISENVNGYLFFITKKDKAIFQSYKKLMQNKQKFVINQVSMQNVKLENNTYAMEAMGGLGANGFYFDWDSGAMLNEFFEEGDKNYGMYTSDMTNDNNVLMLNPVGEGLYPQINYNKNLIRNRVKFNNLFKMFLHFDVSGVYDIDLGDVLNLYFQNKRDFEKHDLYSGNYFVYGISQIFENKMTTHLICSTPFIFKTIPNFTGKAI
jgi:hypothetical protein